MPARLRSLSLRIVQSVSSSSPALVTAASADKKSYGPAGLTDLRALTLDVSSDSASERLLETLLRRNRTHLARVALSGFTTTTLCALLLHARPMLRELYVYAFAPDAAAACGALVLRAAHSGQFGRLRLLALPPLGVADLARCVALRRTAISKFALVTTTTTSSDINDRYKTTTTINDISNKNNKFALGCAEARPPLAQLMVTPPMSPVPFHCDDDHDDDETNDDENDDESLDTHQPGGARPLLDQMALWKTIPFKSEDELDLFMFHSSTAANGLGQLCVL